MGAKAAAQARNPSNRMHQSPFCATSGRGSHSLQRTHRGTRSATLCLLSAPLGASAPPLPTACARAANVHSLPHGLACGAAGCGARRWCVERGAPERRSTRRHGLAASPASTPFEKAHAPRSASEKRRTSTAQFTKRQVAAGHRSAGGARPAATRAPHVPEACRHATYATSWLLSRHEGAGGCICEGKQACAQSCAHLGKCCTLRAGTSA